ncbi:GNAT family N-acetyltransferase [Corallococcus aberystwythensis]|uniref:GNAT family N-acetyltransferase n=1 Tax=Corallococcus aberystwythensis TaxID=2316722 RepID=A0A3A8QHT8_9BACT|nr:GNAT family N-acetyltransferase [Corallococcus aberystwythensis]RKH62734.1 GNAT family N-acetyltransferase [Corallococcus aberystwythensis]
MSRTEIDESYAQFRGAWRLFALGLPKGEVVERADVFITAGHVSWALMNMAFLTRPVETEAQLEHAVDSAARYFEQGPHGWAFTLTPDWLAPALRERADALLAARGLKPGMATTGMVADRLLEPVRPLAPIDLRPVRDEWGYNAVADVNASSYDMPQALGREALAAPGIYGPESRGFVGCHDGAPAASTVALRVDGIVYIALVATLAEHRRKGAAEVVLRRTLEEAKQAWGLERTVLHATEAGAPVYRRMGYRDVTSFCSYFSSAKEA